MGFRYASLLVCTVFLLSSCVSQPLDSTRTVHQCVRVDYFDCDSEQRMLKEYDSQRFFYCAFTGICD